MQSFHWIARLPVLALALALSACASPRPEEVRVGIGAQAQETAKARDYAALYLPYAMMAAAAYTDPYGLNGHQCPDAAMLAHPQPGESASDTDYRTSVKAWIGHLH